jgi:hypothetical protein
LSRNSIVILPMTAGALDFAMGKPFTNQGKCQVAIKSIASAPI